MKILTVKDLLREKIIRLSFAGNDNNDYNYQDKVILSHKKGEQVFGEILREPREVPSGVSNENYKLKRKATEKEIANYKKLQTGKKERLLIAKNLSKELKLEMNFFESRVNFDNRLISFFFVTEQPVDFREFLKKIIPQFPGKRLHLERVGLREKARIIGGIGVCGRSEDCCQFWNINTDVPVPLDAVRDQGIVINKNEKIFGVHGKIKSCFLHEWDLYKEKRKYLPHIKQRVTVGNKKGKVLGLNILNQLVKVAFEDGAVDLLPLADVNFDNKKKAPEDNPIEIPKLEIDLEKTDF